MLCISFLWQGQGSAPSLSAALIPGNKRSISRELPASLFPPWTSPSPPSQWLPQDTLNGRTLCVSHTFRLLAVVFPLSFELCTQQEEKLPSCPTLRRLEVLEWPCLPLGRGTGICFHRLGQPRACPAGWWSCAGP